MRPGTGTTQLKIDQRWLMPVRVGWMVLAITCFVTFFYGVFWMVSTPLPDCTAAGIVCAPSAISIQDVQVARQMGAPISIFGYYLVVSILARLAMAGVGLIIFWRRSDDWLAVMMSGAVLTVLVEGTSADLPGWGIVVAVIYGIGTALFLPLPFVFPNGRLVPRWTGVPVVIITVVTSASYVISYFEPWWFGVASGLNLVWTTLVLYAMTYRYMRVSNPTERQQTKWVLMGIVAALCVGIFFTWMSTVYPSSEPSRGRILALLINGITYLGGYGFFAFGVLVAMLRYRLWDIDIIIRKTLVYGSVTVTLALVYFGSVVLMQQLVGRISGVDNSPVVIVLSTLFIATLFNPLRRRVQDGIDRRFYRSRYNAEKALAQFAEAARRENSQGMLTGQLMDVVGNTMQPEHTELWIIKQPLRRG